MPTKAISTMMRAVVYDAPGGYQVLKVGTLPTPKPVLQKGQVLIKVKACGISRPDVYQRLGAYPPPKGASPILGLEVAGTVVESSDASLTHSDVCALVPGGGYAEYAVAQAEHCLPIPKRFATEYADVLRESPHDHDALARADPFVRAAALPEAVFTVWKNLFSEVDGANSVGVKPGEKLLVQGGSSGVGVVALQLATALGVECYATAGNPTKVQSCLDNGATQAFNYHTDDWTTGCVQAGGMNAVLDIVGGDYLQRNLDALTRNGRLCCIGFLKGSKSQVDLMQLMLKSIHITGSVLRSQPDSLKASLADELTAKVWPLLESGKMNVPVDTVFEGLQMAYVRYLRRVIPNLSHSSLSQARGARSFGEFTAHRQGRHSCLQVTLSIHDGPVYCNSSFRVFTTQSEATDPLGRVFARSRPATHRAPRKTAEPGRVECPRPPPESGTGCRFVSARRQEYRLRT